MERATPLTPGSGSADAETRLPGHSELAGRSAEARRCDAVARGLLVLLTALLLHSAWRVGPTFDEHFYIASGYAYWQDGEFALNREHPPLAKLLVGLPLLFAPGVQFPEHWQQLVSYPSTFFYQLNAADLDRNLFLARLPMCLLTVVMVLAAYRFARRRFSPRAGLVTLLLLGFNPNVLAHGSLAGLDMPVAALMFLSAVAFLDLLEQPSHQRRLLAALTFALANLAKFTALVLGPFYLLLALAACVRRRSMRPLGDVAVTFLAGLTIFAAGYGFEAKSVNEAWSQAPYVIDLRQPRVDADVGPRYLAEVAQRAGMPENLAGRVRQSPDVARAVERLGELAVAGPELAGPALFALRELRVGAGADRKLAFGRALALRAASAEVEALRQDVLAELADLRFADQAAWEAWYARSRHESWDRKIFTQPWIEKLTRGVFGDARPIPLFTAWKGIDYQLYHGQSGHGSYFKGTTLSPAAFEHGNPYPEYYAVVLGLKNPLAWLVLVGLGLVLSVTRFQAWGPLRWATFVLLPLGLFAMFSVGNALMGVRYVLPIYPFLAVLGGAVAVKFPRAALALAAVALLESLWIHPHELMYYNLAAGGPLGGPRTTVIGDDWGQDVRELGRFFARHRAEIEEAGGLWYDPYSTGDVAAFGLDAAHPLPGPVAGIVAVNATIYYREQKRYAWLADFTPFARLGWSIWLYDTRGGPPGTDPGWR